MITHNLVTGFMKEEQSLASFAEKNLTFLFSVTERTSTLPISFDLQKEKTKFNLEQLFTFYLLKLKEFAYRITIHLEYKNIEVFREGL